MKVYVVFSLFEIRYEGDWEIKTQDLEAIFKTQKQAQEYIDSRLRPDEYEIEEWEVQ